MTLHFIGVKLICQALSHRSSLVTLDSALARGGSREGATSPMIMEGKKVLIDEIPIHVS